MIDDGLSAEEIAERLRRDASTVSYWLRKHGLSAGPAQQVEQRGLDHAILVRLVDEGLSVSAIAVEMEKSQATIRQWLAGFGLETATMRRRRERAVESRTAESESDRTLGTCATHGVTPFWRENRGYRRCLKCRQEAVVRRRREVKQILVNEAGGRCVICGYDRYLGALQFHHVDPAQKAFSLSTLGVARSLEKARAEARKCVLLCSNCHAEVEADLAKIPQ